MSKQMSAPLQIKHGRTIIMGKKSTLTPEYIKQRHTVRMATPKHVLTLEANLSEQDKCYVFKEADKLRRCGNTVIAKMMKNYDQLVRTKKYRGLMKAYGKAVEAGDDSLKMELSGKLSAMQVQYNVTWDFCHKKMINLAHKYKIGGVFALTRAEEIWSGVEKLLYSKGEKLHFRECGDLPGIRAKQITGGIAVHAGENGRLRFKFGKLRFVNIDKSKDKFVNDELAAIFKYLHNPDENDRQAVEVYLKDGTLTDTYRPCYAILKCETIRGRHRVFIQLTIEGRAMRKYRKAYNSDGSITYVPRHKYGSGTVGVDIGTQTIAYTSKSEVKLKNLAERGDSIRHREAEERRLRRAMDRSMRAMNPVNYNPDGTVKKGVKTWIRSKRYMNLWTKLKEFNRIAAENRHYAINEDVNHLRELGNVFVTEPGIANILKKKGIPQSKEELADPKVKNKRRKHFGKSILNRCPGYFQSRAKQVFESTGGRYVEVSRNFRATQYDHTADIYTPKDLSQRVAYLSDGSVVQRDLYSSFLLSNANRTYESIDKDKCTEAFPAFYRNEQAMIEEIKKSGKRVMNSGIRTTRRHNGNKRNCA